MDDYPKSTTAANPQPVDDTSSMCAVDTNI